MSDALLAIVTAAGFAFLTWLAQMALQNPHPSRMEAVLSIGLALTALFLVLLFVLLMKAS